VELPDTITFDLKQSHIDNSQCGSSSKCMMANAIYEHLNTSCDVSVLPDRVMVIVHGERNIRYDYYTCEKFATAVTLFDLGRRSLIKTGTYSITRKKS